jgi:methionyl-tRNA formyltransferase
MKIIFMGTPEFALKTLKKLVSSKHEILCVVTQPDRPKGRGRGLSPSPVKRFAQEVGIEVLQPEKARNKDFIESMRQLNPDLIVVVAYGQILSADLLKVPKLFCMNLHGSLLPKYRGAAPIHRAVINGERETGVTTMKMDVGLDTGDIILMQKVPIQDSDDTGTLHDQLAGEGASLVLETVDRLSSSSYNFIQQDDSQATYADKIQKEEGAIPWNGDAETIRNLVRGLNPWPGAFTFLGPVRLRICRAETTMGESGDTPGVVACITDSGIEVGTGNGRLVITELQPAGKKKMSAKSFLAGNKIQPGDIFDSGPETKTSSKN